MVGTFEAVISYWGDFLRGDYFMVKGVVLDFWFENAQKLKFYLTNSPAVHVWLGNCELTDSHQRSNMLINDEFQLWLDL